jgi:FecR protein
MTFRTFPRFPLTLFVAVCSAAFSPVHTAASSARIIRLSLVQGDVRILHDSKGDPLTSDKADWERAQLNLPIRQHDVVATDSGRAEVEFENGAMAFISENTVLEFFDLSLDDGSLTTRLILRQGTASFYVNPARDDYFSVTGGDFTTEAAGRTNFRMDNFDDGSTVAVIKGQVSVLQKNDSAVLVKGQSLTVHAGDDLPASIGRAPDSDEFDRWVSGREDSVVTATDAALQYSNSSPYVSGFGDLYTYGSFYPVGGFGYGWQPYGVGLGWSPFDYGNWFFEPQFGWLFIGSQPWGWLPYHYGGWIFQPGIGWLWTPGGSGRGLPPVKFHPVTATFVRSGNAVGIVPSHPLDVRSKTPLNMAQGIMPLTSRAGVSQSALPANTQWKVVKEPAADSLISHASSTVAPARVARTLNFSSAAASHSQQAVGSSIVYDAREHRFVNSNAPSRAAVEISEAGSGKDSSAELTSGLSRSSTNSSAPNVSRNATVERQVRAVPAPSASSRIVAPPPAARTFADGRGEFSEGSTSRGSSAQMGGSSRSSTASTSRASSGSGRPH